MTQVQENVGPKAFGRWLAGRLRHREWTQADFARAMDTHGGNVSRWVRGEVHVSPATVDRIADVLNEDVDYLLTLAGHRPHVAPVAEDDPRRELHALLDRIELNAERVAALRSVMTAYATRPLDRATRTQWSQSSNGQESTP